MVASSMLDAADISIADVHKDDVVELSQGKILLGCCFVGIFKSEYSFTLDLEQAKKGAQIYLEGQENVLVVDLVLNVA